MDKHAHLGEFVSDLFAWHFQLNKLLLRDVEQSLGGPLAEPVERTAVDKRWELTAADSQVIAYRGHAQTDVEVLTDSLHELLLDQVIATFDLNLVRQLLIDVVFVFR